MQRESNWRLYFTAIILALCIIFIWPTIQYAQFVFTTDDPDPKDYKTVAEYQAAQASYDKQKSLLMRNAISLGLDLVGGADVMLTVDHNAVISRRLDLEGGRLSSELNKSQINHSMSQNEAGNVLTLKLDDNAQTRQTANILNEDYSNLFNYNAQNLLNSGTVKLQLKEKYINNQLSETLRVAENKVRDRIDSFGLTQPSVSRQDELHAILVQIPGERDPEAAINELIRPAELEFFPLYTTKNEKEGNKLHDALVRKLFKPEPTIVTDDNGVKHYKWEMKKGATLPDDLHQVMYAKELSEQEIRENPWKVSAPIAEDPESNNVHYNVYIVTKEPAMTGSDLQNASVQTNMQEMGNPLVVTLQFAGQGRLDFYQLSKDYLQKSVAIALDRKIYSAPVFRSPIPHGSGEISGNFTSDEAHRLAMVLKAGALPTKLNVASSRVIGPSLGEESIIDSTKALMIGAVCVTVFMVLYYGTAGVVSVLALILNVLVILGCLDMFNATLTLSGIGGMILTLGMAVDANVLIYERIREELDAGADLVNGIRSGFGHAFSVIFDSNLTTLLAAFVLLQFGQGSVQGFALTMAFGLLANLFTGLTVTYALCRLWFTLTGGLSLGRLRIFKNPKINFIDMRKGSFALSTVLVICSIGFLIYNGGPNMAVDFESGLLTEVQVDKEGDLSDEIREAMSVSGLTNQAKVQRIEGQTGNRYLIRIAQQEVPEGVKETPVEYTERMFAEKMTGQFGQNYEILDRKAVSEEVGSKFRNIAIMVVIAASFCILLYLWFRFELVFGAAAVLALVHDLTITLGVITLLNVEISLDIVSALLILLGFSVNDTIVIFDRVRENSHSMFGHTFKDVCNRAMNQCLSRTVITSFTTVGIMLIMYFFGGRSLAPFALTLIVGGIVGTYSSDFVASPFVYWFNSRQKGKLMEHLGRKGQAAAQKQDAPAGAKPIKATTSGDSSGAPRRGRR